MSQREEREREMGAAPSRELRGFRRSIVFVLLGCVLSHLSIFLCGGGGDDRIRGLLLSCTVCAIVCWILSKIADLQPEPPTPEFYCAICLELKPPAEAFAMNHCPHSFCSSCVAHYVADKVSENLLTIPCPSCPDGFFELEACRFILPQAVVDRWERAICESAIGGRLYCPFPDCSALLVDDRGEDLPVISRAECPHCHRLFCASCQVPWHFGVSCDQYGSLGEDERGRTDLDLIKMATINKWQRCPSCRFFVERTQGCNLIKCRCGTKFCYNCASEMKTEDHYCDQCKC